MCKLFIYTKHDSSKLFQTIEAAWRVMSTTERDGFGAAWITRRGRIGWAKSSSPALRHTLPDFVSGFGAVDGADSDGGALIIHGRTATCGVSLENTHPFIDGRTALVHNGVVSSEVWDNVDSSCDSELLLRAYNHGGITAVESGIQGYYAFAHLSTSKGKVHLHVARDNKASLYTGKIGGAWCFATRDTQLQAAGADVVGEFRQCYVARFINGSFVGGDGFVPAVPPVQLAAKASKAIGSGRVRASDEAYDDWVNPELRLSSTNWRGAGK